MNRFGLFAALLLAGAAGCYNTGDLGDAPFKCTLDFPECPDGYECDGKFCRKAGGGGMPLVITKQTTVPPTMDPGLDPASCPDAGLEPNNSTSQASPIGDRAKLTNLAICTSGDVDYFQSSAQGQYVKVIIEYSAKSGDLDVALIDGAGTIKDSDGSARDNGCVVSSAPVNGPVYIGVVGANNKDRNRYSITMELHQSTSKPTCTTGS